MNIAIHRVEGVSAVARWCLAALLVFGGSLAPACRARPCDNDTAPEGTRFQVEVLEEMPNSYGCHLFAVQPGEAFFLTAGPTVEVGRGEQGGPCPVTKAAGPPEGVETQFEYVAQCSGAGALSSRCDIRFPDLCPGVANAGYVRFNLKGSELLDATPSEARFEILTWVDDECSPSASCSDIYRVRISRVTEE